MANSSYAQYNFTGGEWSVARQGAVDDPRYKHALGKCLNYIPTMEGSLAPRSGFRRLGVSQQGLQAITLPFRFSNTEAYVCTVSDTLFRLWANGLQIIQDSLNISSVSVGGTPTFTMASAFPEAWSTFDRPCVKIHFSSMTGMENAPFLVNRTFELNITGSNTCTLSDEQSGHAITTPVTGTFTARMDLMWAQDTPASLIRPENLRMLEYTSQRLSNNGRFATPPVHRAAVITTQFPPVAFSSDAGVLNPIYEQFIDGPYFDSQGTNDATLVSGVSGDITVTLYGYSSSVTYFTGSVVFDSGSSSTFVSLVDNNKGNALPSVASAFWAKVASAWNSGTTYGLGAPATYNPQIGAVGTTYYSIQAANTNENPITQPTWWSRTPPTFAGGTTYGVGAIVVSSGIKYVSIQAANTGHTPASSPTWWLPVDMVSAVNGVPNSFAGQATQALFSASDVGTASAHTVFGTPGRLIRLKVGPAPWQRRQTYAKNDLVNFNDVIYISLASSNTGNEPDQDAVNWQIETTTIQWTWGKIKAYTSPYQATVTILGDDLANSNPVWEYRLGVFSDTTGWPGVGVYHEGRVGLSGAIPNRIDFGQPDQGFSFSPTAPDGTVSDGNGIAMLLNSAGNEHIQSLASSVDGVLAFTDMGEWIIAASNLNDPLTPTSAQAKRGTTFTSAYGDNAPLTNAHAFAQGNRRRLLEYKSFIDPTAYQVRPNASDLTRDCQHLTLQGITQAMYQRNPQPIIWCVVGGTEPQCSQNVFTDNLMGIGYIRSPDVSYVAPFSFEHGIEYLNQLNEEFDPLRNTRFACVQYGPTDTKEYLYTMGFDTDSGVNGWVEMLEPVMDTSGAGDGSLSFDGQPHDLSDQEKMKMGSVFLDAAVRPAGYKALADQSGVTFYGLWPHAGNTVSFTICGVYIGDYLIGNDGTVTISFATGVATSSNSNGFFSGGNATMNDGFSYYMMKQANNSLIVQSTLPVCYQEFLSDLNGGIYGPNGGVTRTGFCAWFGYKYRRRGQLLRPQTGSQNGPTFAKTVRNSRMGVHIDNAHEISVGGTFDTLVPATLTIDGPRDVTPLGISDLTSGIYRDFINDDLSFDGQLCWEQTTPMAGGVLAAGGFSDPADV